jgi:hypothetical protein
MMESRQRAVRWPGLDLSFGGAGVGHVVGHGSCSPRSISSLRASGCAISTGQSVLGGRPAPS